jgi:hypothetical protein
MGKRSLPVNIAINTGGVPTRGENNAAQGGIPGPLRFFHWEFPTRNLSANK